MFIQELFICFSIKLSTEKMDFLRINLCSLLWITYKSVARMDFFLIGPIGNFCVDSGLENVCCSAAR